MMMVKLDSTEKRLTYLTLWDDFTIKTTYHRIFDLFVTTVRGKYSPSVLAFSYTANPWAMRIQHDKGLEIAWKILYLSRGNDDF